MTTWGDLSAELDAWEKTKRPAEFWWRDDDAVEATPALDRLTDLAERLDVPPALAAVPAAAQPSLADAITGRGGIDVLQHGYAHVSHRPAGQKKAELGTDRDLWTVARELAEGRRRMIDLFGDDGWLEVIVPPWNRIDPPVVALLPGLGFHGLTTLGARRAEEAAPHLRVVNVHIDIIDWRGRRGFAGEPACLAAAVGHLAAKREGRADPAEPTGLLSHHLVHDADCWTFLERFFATTSEHGAACWRRARDLFPLAA